MRTAPWSDVTGQNVTSWSGFALLLPYSLVSIFLANPDITQGAIVLRLSLALVAQVLLFGLLLGWRHAVNLWPRLGAGAVRVLLAFAVVSAIRGLLLAQVLDVLGLTAGIDWSRRLVGGVIGFATALAIVDLILGSVRRHRMRVGELRARQAAAEVALVSTRAGMEEQRDALVERIRMEFLRRLKALATGDAALAAQQLHAVANDLVRPLSRQLADRPAWRPPSESAVRTTFDPVEFAADATSGRPLQPGWVAVLFLFFGGPFMLHQQPLREALPLLTIGAVMVWCLMAAANRPLQWSARRPIATRVTVLVVVVLFAGAVVAASSLLLVSASDALLRRIMVGDLFLIPAIALSLVAVRAASAQEASIVARLETSTAELDWASARARCMQWRQQRSLARALHGPLQNAIGAGAIRLEQAADSGIDDPALLAATRAHLMSVIDRMDTTVGDSAQLEAVLHEYAETWAGVCEITWELTTSARFALEADPIACFATTELATEACWNAIRHGDASRVAITVGPVDRRLRLIVTNDGPGVVDDATPGLGTQMLNDMTLEWHRTGSVTGTTLVADVPLHVP